MVPKTQEYFGFETFAVLPPSRRQGGKVALQTKQSVNKPQQYLKSYNLKRERVINCDYGLSP